MADLAKPEPSNAEILNVVEKHTKDDRAVQAKQEVFNKKQERVNDDAKKSRDAIHKRLTDIPDKEETARIVEDVITKMLFKKGKLTISVLLGAGAIAAALVAIIGGFKAVLALFFLSR